MADDAWGLCDHLGLDRVHLFGVSLGGMIVQQMAIDRPERVGSLTSLMSTTGDPDVGQPSPEGLASLIEPSPTEREAYIAAAVEAATLDPAIEHVDLDWVAERNALAFDRCFCPDGHRAAVRRRRGLAVAVRRAAGPRRAGPRDPRRGRSRHRDQRRGTHGGVPARVGVPPTGGNGARSAPVLLGARDPPRGRARRPLRRLTAGADATTHKGTHHMGPLAGVRVVEIAGIGPGPFAAMMLADMGADIVRVDRAGNVWGGDPAAPPKDIMNRGRRSIGVDLKNPEGVETVLRARREGRRADRGLPPRRHRAPRHRPRRVPRAQPAPRLRPHDRLGPGRPHGPDGRPRHELHRHRGRARRHRSARRAAPAAAQPRRRLRGRRHAPRLRDRVRRGRGPHVRARARSSTPPWSTAPPCSRPSCTG